jgi:hypothetical protein
VEVEVVDEAAAEAVEEAVEGEEAAAAAAAAAVVDHLPHVPTAMSEGVRPAAQGHGRLMDVVVHSTPEELLPLTEQAARHRLALHHSSCQ